jgi:hypothetical protein
VEVLEITLICSLGPHYAPPKKFADKPKSVLAALQFTDKEVMLICRLHLPFPDCFDRSLLRCAGWAVCILIPLIQASLVKRVLAKEMDSWQVQAIPTRHAAACLENDGLATELLNLLFLVFSFPAIALY